MHRPARPGTASRSTRVWKSRPPGRRRSSSTNALDQAAVQRAHEVGVLLGQLAERAVGEGHDRAPSSSSATAGSKPSRACSTTSASRVAVPGAHWQASAGPARVRRRRRRRAPRPAAWAACEQHPGEGAGTGRVRAPARGRRRRASSGAAGGPTSPRDRLATSSRPTSRMRSRWGRTVFDVQAEHVGDLGRGQRQRAIGPARGRWRSGCCRPGP